MNFEPDARLRRWMHRQRPTQAVPTTGVCLRCGFVADLDLLDAHTARCEVDPVAAFWSRFGDCWCGAKSGEHCPGDLPHADRPRLDGVVS